MTERSAELVGPHGLVTLREAFEGRRQLIAYYFMWYPGYRNFIGWDVPWYSAEPSLDMLLEGRQVGSMHLVCYVRDGDRVFETYWTTGRGVELMDYSYALEDLTVYGRQEPWEDSPPGWPQSWSDGPARIRTDGRPIAQWSRLHAGRSDDLTVAS